jgi:hypothetical protein
MRLDLELGAAKVKVLSGSRKNPAEAGFSLTVTDRLTG